MRPLDLHHVVCAQWRRISRVVRPVLCDQRETRNKHTLPCFLGVGEADMCRRVGVVRRPERVRPHRKVGHLYVDAMVQ